MPKDQRIKSKSGKERKSEGLKNDKSAKDVEKNRGGSLFKDSKAKKADAKKDSRNEESGLDLLSSQKDVNKR